MAKEMASLSELIEHDINLANSTYSHINFLNHLPNHLAELVWSVSVPWPS